MELLPCPFCGGPATHILYLPEGCETGKVSCIGTGSLWSDCPMEGKEVEESVWQNRPRPPFQEIPGLTNVDRLKAIGFTSISSGVLKAELGAMGAVRVDRLKLGPIVVRIESSARGESMAIEGPNSTEQ